MEIDGMEKYMIIKKIIYELKNGTGLIKKYDIGNLEIEENYKNGKLIGKKNIMIY